MTNNNKEETLKDSVRLFQCARCWVQVKICTDCDRGNIYCSPSCSFPARRRARCAASQRYQRTVRGRQNHARCQQRYREKQRAKIKVEISAVIDQGSPSNLHELSSPARDEGGVLPKEKPMTCDLCGRASNGYIRRDFLNHYRRVSLVLPSSSMAFAQGP